MRISDWSSDVCSSDLRVEPCEAAGFYCEPAELLNPVTMRIQYRRMINYSVRRYQNQIISRVMQNEGPTGLPARLAQLYSAHLPSFTIRRSEEHTSELQSLMRISYAVFCLTKNKTYTHTTYTDNKQKLTYMTIHYQ